MLGAEGAGVKALNPSTRRCAVTEKLGEEEGRGGGREGRRIRLLN